MDKSQLDLVKNEIIASILQAADPVLSVENIFAQNSSQEIQLDDLKSKGYKKIHLISVGKAAVTMAQGLINVMGNEISGGVIVHKSDYQFASENWHHRFQIKASSHPVPDQRSVNAAKAIIHYLSDLGESDFVFFLISGGGSALITYPEADITLADMMKVNLLLLECGATINEINCIRKHIDQVKGGKLIKKTIPAGFCTLILSDVLGDPLDVIASGPTVPDSSTYQDATEVIEKYGLGKKIPLPISKFIDQGLHGLAQETIKGTDLPDTYLPPVIIGGNKNSLSAAAGHAKNFGMTPILLNNHLVGEARTAAHWVIEEAKKFISKESTLKGHYCFLCGGETTVTIHGIGLGGRNLELALAAVEGVSKLPGAYFVTFATDGEDGPTDAAGAWVDSDTFLKAKSAGLDIHDFLERNDSYHFFEQIGQLIQTGSSGTNVNDICFLIMEKK